MTIAAKVTVTSHFKQFRKDYTEELETKFDQAAELLKSHVQRSMRTSNRQGSDPSPPGEPPHRGQSQLVNSIIWERTGPLRRIVGTRLAYGRIQELGGWIFGGDSRMPVPLSKQAKRHRTRGGSPRTFPKELTFIHRGKKPPLLVEKQNRKWIIHYILMDKVYLPPRPFLRPAAESEQFHSQLERLFASRGDVGVRVE